MKKIQEKVVNKKSVQNSMLTLLENLEKEGHRHIQISLAGKIAAQLTAKKLKKVREAFASY